MPKVTLGRVPGPGDDFRAIIADFRTLKVSDGQDVPILTPEGRACASGGAGVVILSMREGCLKVLSGHDGEVLIWCDDREGSLVLRRGEEFVLMVGVTWHLEVAGSVWQLQVHEELDEECVKRPMEPRGAAPEPSKPEARRPSSIAIVFLVLLGVVALFMMLGAFIHIFAELT